MNDTGSARENSHPVIPNPRRGRVNFNIVIPNPRRGEESFTGARERFLAALGMTG